jgi:hypothetical protein
MDPTIRLGSFKSEPGNPPQEVPGQLCFLPRDHLTRPSRRRTETQRGSGIHNAHDMMNGLFQSWDDDYDQQELRLKDGSQLQFVDSLSTVASTSIKKFQYACLVRDERMVLVWHDDLQQIIPHATRLEEKLLSLVRLDLLQILLKEKLTCS